MDTDTPTAQRPAAVIVIGWIYVAAGALALVTAWLGLAGWWAIVGFQRGHLLTPPADVPSPLVWISRMFVVFDLLALAQIAAGVLAIVAGVQFLRLRPWTRPVLEALGWIALVVAMVVGVLWESTWLAVTERMVASGMQQRIAAIVGVLTGSAMVVLWSLPAAIMIMVLRGASVRQALAREPR